MGHKGSRVAGGELLNQTHPDVKTSIEVAGVTENLVDRIVEALFGQSAEVRALACIAAKGAPLL